MNSRVKPTPLPGRATVKLHCEYRRCKVLSSARNIIWFVEEAQLHIPLVYTSLWGGNLGVPVLNRVPTGSAALVPPCPPVLSAGFLSSQADTTHPLTKHRKIASSFRDSSLFDIFTLSCNLLKQVRNSHHLASLMGTVYWGKRLWAEVPADITLLELLFRKFCSGLVFQESLT